LGAPAISPTGRGKGRLLKKKHDPPKRRRNNSPFQRRDSFDRGKGYSTSEEKDKKERGNSFPCNRKGRIV